MAKANLHTLRLTDLQVLALASAKPKETEEGSLYGKLLTKAFNEAHLQLNAIAQKSILNDEPTAPSDEFDNPPKTNGATSATGNDAESVQVEAEKDDKKTTKAKQFQPSVD